MQKVKGNSQSIKLENQKIILKNINTLLKRGYSINESIKFLNIQQQDYIYGCFLEGELLSYIFASLGFDKDVLLILEISESSGQLYTGIDKAYSMILHKMNNKNNVLEKLRYPLLLLVFLMLALLFISNFLLPMFYNVYDNFGIEITGWFLIFLMVLTNLPKLLLCIFIGVIILMFYYKLLKESDRLKLVMKNKFVKKQYYKTYNNIFLVNLCSLLKLGISIDEIFLILSNQKYNYYLKYECTKIYKQLCKGEDLVNVLIKRKIYNKNIVFAIEEGMRTGTLLESLNSIMLLEQEKIEERFNTALMLIQPIIYLIFGITIVLLYMSIFIPMFKIMDSL